VRLYLSMPSSPRRWVFRLPLSLPDDAAFNVERSLSDIASPSDMHLFDDAEVGIERGILL